MNFRGAIFLCSIIMTAFMGVAGADEVYLVNGDRITGQVMTMNDGKLVLETSYAGTINIKWEDVSELRTDAPISVILKDETVIQGISRFGLAGEMKMESDLIAAPVSLKMADVKAINPKIEPAVKWMARVNVGIKIESGNRDSEDYHIDTELVSRTDTNRFTAGLELDRELYDDKRTENKWLAYTKYDHFLTEKWYLNTNASFEKDDFKDINARTVLGAGAGHQFWHSDLKNLSSELGFAYVNESYAGETEDKDYLAYRWASNFDWFLYKDVVQFFHWNEAFMSSDDYDDIWVRTRTGLRFPLYKGLTWTVQYNYDWDNVPSEGQERTDTTLLFTLGYQFGRE